MAAAHFYNAKWWRSVALKERRFWNFWLVTFPRENQDGATRTALWRHWWKDKVRSGCGKWPCIGYLATASLWQTDFCSHTTIKGADKGQALILSSLYRLAPSSRGWSSCDGWPDDVREVRTTCYGDAPRSKKCDSFVVWTYIRCPNMDVCVRSVVDTCATCKTWVRTARRLANQKLPLLMSCWLSSFDSGNSGTG